MKKIYVFHCPIDDVLDLNKSEANKRHKKRTLAQVVDYTNFYTLEFINNFWFHVLSKSKLNVLNCFEVKN